MDHQILPADEAAAKQAAIDAAAFRAQINRRMAEADQREYQTNPKLRRSIWRKRLMTTVSHHWFPEAHAYAVMKGLKDDMKAKLPNLADDGETFAEVAADLKNPAKNFEDVDGIFRIKVDPSEIKRAFRSFVFRRDLSRRMRGAMPEKQLPPGVMSEAELAEIRADMRDTFDEKWGANADAAPNS